MTPAPALEGSYMLPVVDVTATRLIPLWVYWLALAVAAVVLVAS